MQNNCNASRRAIMIYFSIFLGIYVLSSIFTFFSAMQILGGRRGIISIEEQDGKTIATKSAKDATKKGAINKESQIISYMNTHDISFVPNLIASGDGRFSYSWIIGNHFKDVYTKAPKNIQQLLIYSLLEKAYQLDTLGVVHGELIRPFTNVLVTPDLDIRIIDFERGTMGDTSGKNMRSYAQRLLAEGRIDLTITKSLGTMKKDDIYTTVSTHIGREALLARPGSVFGRFESIFGRFESILKRFESILKRFESILKRFESIFSGGFIFGHAKSMSLQMWQGWYIIGGLIALDQLTKYLFYTLERGSQTLLLTPILNTGIGWSLPVPLSFVMGFTVLICGGVIWGRHKRYLPNLAAICILAGAGGNLIDRVLFSGVRDFIDLQYRPIFNFADIYLTCAVFVLLFLGFFPSHDKNN